MRFPRLFLPACALFAACAAFAADTLHTFDLPAGDAADTLRRFAQQAGREIVYPAQEVRGHQTNPVRGELPVADALRQLLAGTALVTELDKQTGAFAVRKRTADPNGPRAAPATTSDRPSANVAVAGAPAGEETIFELSPFVVSTARDTGYSATETLSGTRTHTALKDVASPVGVFTQEFIRDLGATNESDIMAYSASAVPELTDQTANIQGIGIIQPGVFSFRIRGQAASRTRNYFNTLVPPDTYNIDRFDEARGPNAILFGLGGAGGILNQTSKRAELTRPRTELAATAGRDELVRGEIDHNQVLRRAAVALRFNGTAQSSGGWRPYEFDRERRGHLAGTFAFNPRIKLYLEFEAGSIHDTASRDFGTNDYLSLWLDQGRTTTALKTANTARGIALTANQQRVTIIGNDGSIRNFQQAPVSTTDAARLGGAIVDPTLVPFDAFIPGPGSERFIYFDSHAAFLELQPARDLFIELAADYQSSNSKIYDTTNGVYQLFADPALTFRDGAANPYAGDLYLDTRWVLRKAREDLRNLRATASYSLNLGPWGRHNLAAMVQDSRDASFNNNQVPVLLGSPFDATPSNARNQVNTRSYVTNPSDPSQFAVASWRQIPAQASVIVNAGAAPSAYDTGWITQATDLSDDWTTVRSYLASTQSYFLHDRLVASLGARRDERTAHVRGGAVDPATNVYNLDYRSVTETRTTANQTSLGLVGHLTSWLSLSYNRSRNAQVPGSQTMLIPDNSLLPISRGRGEDLGLTFSLLENRVSFRVAYFKTSVIDANKAFNAGGQTATRNSRILDTMVTDRILTSAQADAARFVGQGFDLLDRKTDGWELGLTANPTRNWRIFLNASQGLSVETNLLKRTRSIMDQMLAGWRTARPTSITANSITVAQEIADFNTWFATTTAVEGKSSLGDREWQAKLFNRYDFSSGPLKGFFAGGGWRYQSAPTIGAKPSTGELYQGESITELDLLVGYQTRLAWFSHKTRLSIQLNGKDLLHQHDYLSIRRDANGLLIASRIVDPASYSLTARLSF